MYYDLIQISKLNDFIFCPYSIFLHSIYQNFEQVVYHQTNQKRGKIRHQNIELKKYTTSKHILQAKSVYSKKLGLVGKIDIYDNKNKYLIERKYKVKRIYKGYLLQLYAQYYCMLEEGYKIKKIFIHSLSDNKRYSVPLPTKVDKNELLDLIEAIRIFNPNTDSVDVSAAKCCSCIYKTLCEYSKC